MKLRNNIKSRLIKLIIIIIVIILSFIITFKILYEKININIDNNKYINYLVNDSLSRYSIGDIKSLSSTEFLLKYSFGIEKFNDGTVTVETPIIEEVQENIDPIVYIYNSHQGEAYRSLFLDTFNINNTVYIASHILKEYLEDLGINTIVETRNITDILNANGWKYGYSYKASRVLLEDSIKNNPSLKFFIDLHRDSAGYERTTLEYNGIKYAKVMFIVGKEHENYEANLNLANTLNEKLKSLTPDISRGVLEKSGPGVNGIYNQDFNSNTILIEVGGQYNYIEEVNNSLKLIADVLYDYLKGNV